MLQARRPTEGDKSIAPASARLTWCGMPMWLPDWPTTGSGTELRCTSAAGHRQPHAAHAGGLGVVAVAYDKPTPKAVNEACRELQGAMEDLGE